MASRIQLAHIQGVIHEQIYSVRASTQPPALRQQSIETVHDMLRSWLGTIPAELKPDCLLSSEISPCVKRQLVMLYFGYVACFLHVHRVGTHEAEWISRLATYSQGIIGIGSREAAVWESDDGWDEVVVAARDCAQLMRVVEFDDSALIWNTTCTYISASLVLIANTLTISEHNLIDPYIDTDAQLITETLTFLEKATVQSPSYSPLATMHTATTELSCRARIARTQFMLGGQPIRGKTSASVAWLEGEARRSAGYSAAALVEAFTTAEVKPLATRMWGSKGQC